MNKPNILLLFFSLIALQLSAQYKVTFNVIQEGPAKYDSIFICGTFNSWQMGNPQFCLATAGNEKSITLDLPGKNVEYFFSHGKKNYSAENTKIGSDSNRSITINKDTTVRVTILRWNDDISYFKNLLHSNIPDSEKIWTTYLLGNYYTKYPETYNPDSALWCGHQLQFLLQKLKSDRHNVGKTEEYADIENKLRYGIAEILTAAGNFSEALQLRLEALHDMEESGNSDNAYWQICDISNQYLYMKDYREALKYCYRMKNIIQSGYKFKTDKWKEFFSGYQAEVFYLNGLTLSYIGLKRWDSALYYGLQYNEIARIRNEAYSLAVSSVSLGDIYEKTNRDELAFSFYRKCVAPAIFAELIYIVGSSELGIAKLFQRQNKYDSALFYARKSWSTYRDHNIEIQMNSPGSSFDFIEAGEFLSKLYQGHGQFDSAYKYLQFVASIKDSIYNQENLRQAQNVTFNETLREQKLTQEKKDADEAYKARIKLYAFISGLIVLAVIIFILFRNNKQKNNSNKLLQIKNEQIQKALVDLKETQAQLIQSEKMASLGELTAGIAHEIQNPLNFVNNFSEVSTELIKEMVEESDKGNTTEVKAIAADLVQNLEKINHHGKRADAIVKGMLQHSRSSSGQKEPTDINALCDEYLRLAFHGLRAKDKSFNATLKTDYDERIDKINIIPQDIGRVVLNLITNAFYAVKTPKPPKGGVEFQPTVTVGTKKTDGRIEIRVSDNGTGIPTNILDKIFQPFFTTKPTGEGTGLGLSLSYDIVKAHRGELKVETKENEGTTFIIQLPNNNV